MVGEVVAPGKERRAHSAVPGNCCVLSMWGGVVCMGLVCGPESCLTGGSLTAPGQGSCFTLVAAEVGEDPVPVRDELSKGRGCPRGQLFLANLPCDP